MSGAAAVVLELLERAELELYRRPNLRSSAHAPGRWPYYNRRRATPAYKGDPAPLAADSGPAWWRWLEHHQVVRP